MNEEYMTTNEVAALTRVPRETLRYWRHHGQGPKSFKLGRRVLYAREDVDAFIAAAPQAGGADAAELTPDPQPVDVGLLQSLAQYGTGISGISYGTGISASSPAALEVVASIRAQLKIQQAAIAEQCARMEENMRQALSGLVIAGVTSDDIEEHVEHEYGFDSDGEIEPLSKTTVAHIERGGAWPDNLKIVRRTVRTARTAWEPVHAGGAT